MNFLARLISLLFHPLLMPTYLYTILSLALPSALSPLRVESHMAFILMLFLLTFALPAINIGIFRVFGNIKSFSMSERRERIMPFILITIIYLISTWVFFSKIRISPDDSAIRFLMIIDLLVIVSTVMTFFFKISVHSVASWGMVGITLLLTKISEVNAMFYISLALILLAGIIMSSRLQLGVHSYREVMWGSVLGLATSIVGMMILF